MSEENIIYSQQFIPADLPDFSGPDLSEEETAEFEAWYKRQREALKNLVYTPIPGREKESRTFVALALELSRRYRISMEITQFPDEIKVSLSTHSCVFSGKLLHHLTKLMDMCDRVVTFCPGDGSTEHMVFLQFYTHEPKIL